jgi:iron complex transport system substrate-binding protein
MALALLALTLAAVLKGCDGGKPAPAAADDTAAASVRIASFSPAISRTLVDLGLADLIVGRTRYCDFLDDAIPPVGDLLEIDFETLVRVRPTHVLVQPPASGVDTELEVLCEEQGWRLATWRIDSIDEIESVVRDLPDVLFTSGSAQHVAATSKAAELLNDMAQALSPRGQNIFTGPTLLVHHIDPVGVSGRGTYLHELLARLGGTNAIQSEGWVELTLEDIARMNPQAIVLVLPSVSSDTDATAAAGALATMDIEAARTGRIAALRHRDAQTPSTAVAEVADELRGVLASFANPTHAGESSR